jgi:hypothetical protein
MELRAQKEVGDDRSEPSARRVLSIPFMPMLHDVIRGHAEGERKHFDVSGAGEVTSELLWKNRQVV